MVLTRRSSGFLLAVAVWSWVIWPTFFRNIYKDARSFDAGHHPTGFLIVHGVLVAVSLIIGTGIGWLGWKGWRASRTAAISDRALRSFVSTNRD